MLSTSWYCRLSSFYYAIITDLLFTAQFDAHCYSYMQVVTFSMYRNMHFIEDGTVRCFCGIHISHMTVENVAVM